MKISPRGFDASLARRKLATPVVRVAIWERWLGKVPAATDQAGVSLPRLIGTE
jgi:hypothetical protein